MQTSGAQTGETRWSNTAVIARFSFKRWYIVFPIFVVIGLGSLYLAATSLQKSLAPLGLATVTDSDSETELALNRAFFQEDLEASIFMFTSETVAFESASGVKNEKFVDEYDQAVTIIQQGAPNYVGEPLSPVTSTLVPEFVSQDKMSVLAQVPLYGSSSQESPISLTEVGLDQIQDAIDKAERETDMQVDFVSESRLEDALSDAAVQEAGQGLVWTIIPVLVIAVVAIGTLVGAILLFVVPFLSGPLMVLFLSLGGITVLGQFVPINLFGVISLALVSLALGGDFLIHIFYGYRRRVGEGEEPIDAIGGAAEISGRASIIAAVIAGLAMIPILFFPSTVFASFAWAAMLVLVIQILVMALFVPAVIGMLGKSLLVSKLPWHDPTSDPLNWRLARPLSWSLGHPRSALAIAVVGLAILIIPLFSMFAITGSVSLVPEDEPARQAADAIQETFVPGVPGASTIVVRSQNAMLDSLADTNRAVEFQSKIKADKDTWFAAGPEQLIDQFKDQIPESLTLTTLMAGQELLDTITSRNLGALVPVLLGGDVSALLGSGGSDLTDEEKDQEQTQITLDALNLAVKDIPGIASSVLAVTNGDFIAVQAIPVVDPETPEALEWVERIRGYADDVYGPFQDGDFIAVGRAYPGGNIASSLDVQDVLRSDTPWVFLATALILFVGLSVALRAPVAAAVVVLSEVFVVGAAFGIMVAIFQWGWFFGVNDVGFIEVEIVVLMVPILLALATSFSVLLLYRVREEMGTPGPLVRSETLRHIMSSVRVGLAGSGLLLVIFFIFSLADAVLLAQIGVGLTALVLLDVVFIRTLVLPAAIGLLGRRMWWMPFGLGVTAPDQAAMQPVEMPYAVEDSPTDPGIPPVGPPVTPTDPGTWQEQPPDLHPPDAPPDDSQPPPSTQ